MTDCISLDGDTIVVRTPYNRPFVRAAREAGGVWDKERKVWVFAHTAEERVRALVRAHYGDGAAVPSAAGNLPDRALSELARVRDELARALALIDRILERANASK
jgi:hypothetical protein